jgi:hypothetical protein
MKIKIKISNIIATAFKPWIMLNEENGFSLTTIGLRPIEEKALYPLPGGSGNSSSEYLDL